MDTMPSRAQSVGNDEWADEDSTRSSWFGWRRILLVLLLLLLAFLLYKAVRIGLYSWDAYSSVTALRQQRSAGLGRENFALLEAPLANLSEAFAGIEGELRLLTPLFHGLAWLPGYGPTIASVPDLVAAGRQLTDLAANGVSAVAPAMSDHPDAPLLQVVLGAIPGNEETFAILAGYAAGAQQALDRVPVDKLHPALSERVGQVQASVDLLAPALNLAPSLPNLLGVGQPRKYLVLVQNNHELRATGGFLTAVGALTLDAGEITGMEFTDSYNIERHDVDHPWSPLPMQRYMGIDLIFLRDANWSPDLPTTAKMAQALYAQDAGQHIDGIATIDMRSVELLMRALDPLKVAGAKDLVTSKNIIDQIKQFWDQPIETGDTLQEAGFEDWWKQRKDFMPALAQAALERIQSGDVDYLILAESVRDALKERAIQVWIDDPAVSTQLTELGWDGGLHPKPGADFLALVDTNMGYNKVDAALNRSVRYHVTWPDGADKPGLATAAVTYQHPIPVPDYVCDNSPHYGATYDDMIRRCYFNYMRLYAPAGSELVSIDGVESDSAASQYGENDTQVFAGYFVMEPGSDHTVTFTYRLPAHITPSDYELVVQRQAGTKPLSLQVSVADETLSTRVAEGELTWTPGE